MAQDVLFAVEDTDDTLLEEDLQESQTEKYLLFTSADLLFGVPSEYVTKLPLVPTYVRGIINLRGQIIPIVDTRILLRCDGEDNQCIIILNIEGTLVGILIDSVMKMVDVDKESLRQDLAQKAQNLVSGMCSLPDGQTMLVFDCAQILNQV